MTKQLRVLADTALTTLEMAEQLGASAVFSVLTQTHRRDNSLCPGNVLIITNSAPGWVETSCQQFLPTLMARVRTYVLSNLPALASSVLCFV